MYLDRSSLCIYTCRKFQANRSEHPCYSQAPILMRFKILSRHPRIIIFIGYSKSLTLLKQIHGNEYTIEIAVCQIIIGRFSSRISCMALRRNFLSLIILFSIIFIFKPGTIRIYWLSFTRLYGKDLSK